MKIVAAESYSKNAMRGAFNTEHKTRVDWGSGASVSTRLPLAAQPEVYLYHKIPNTLEYFRIFFPNFSFF